MSHENYVLSCAQWLVNICGSESNHFFNTSGTFKVIIVDAVILSVSQWTFSVVSPTRSYADELH